MLRRAPTAATAAAVASMTTISSSTTSARLFTIVRLPALSPTMEVGKVVEWLKQPGEKISIGDAFCKIETDKAATSFDNTLDDGIIARHLIAAGTSRKVGDPICLMAEDEAEAKSDAIKNWVLEGEGDAAPAAPAAAAAAAAAPTDAAPAAPLAHPGTASGGRVFASPLARKTARELGVDVTGVTGTGGSVGRVTKADIEKAAANPPPKPMAVPAAAAVAAASAAATPPPPPPPAPAPAPGAAFVDTPVSGMRATIARRLTQSKNVEVPHYYLMNECNATSMMKTIKHLNAKGGGKFKISVNDYIVKAVTRANLIVPQCNSHWHTDFIRQYSNVDVSVAVATPAGLITPIIRNAHAKGLAEISIEMKELAKRARDGALKPNEYLGGTVTISNLGAMGIPNFTAIINQPHSMILACGGLVPRPEIVKNEETGEHEMTGKVVQTISFTGSFDHRVVDGATGAEWFKHFKDAIENPLSLLL